jgi:hypothetical protein
MIIHAQGRENTSSELQCPVTVPGKNIVSHYIPAQNFTPVINDPFGYAGSHPNNQAFLSSFPDMRDSINVLGINFPVDAAHYSAVYALVPVPVNYDLGNIHFRAWFANTVNLPGNTANLFLGITDGPGFWGCGSQQSLFQESQPHTFNIPALSGGTGKVEGDFIPLNNSAVPIASTGTMLSVFYVADPGVINTGKMIGMDISFNLNP